jgi:hypothetical protein
VHTIMEIKFGIRIPTMYVITTCYYFDMLWFGCPILLSFNIPSPQKLSIFCKFHPPILVFDCRNPTLG